MHHTCNISTHIVPARMCVYIYIYMYVCMYVCMYVYIYIYVCMCMYVFVCIYIYVYIYIYIYLSLSISLSIHIYIYIYIHTPLSGLVLVAFPLPMQVGDSLAWHVTTIIIRYIIWPCKKTCVGQVVLDRWFPLREPNVPWERRASMGTPIRYHATCEKHAKKCNTYVCVVIPLCLILCHFPFRRFRLLLRGPR